MKFVVIVHNRPDFIKLQYDTLKKHIKGKFEYIVWIDSWDDEKRATKIKRICDSLNVEWYRIRQRNFDFEEEFKHGPAQHMIITLNWLWRNYMENLKGLVCYLDSDMFLIKDIDPKKFMNGYDIAFYLYDEYIWSGLQFFNMDTLPNPQDIDWDRMHLGNRWGTMGAATYPYLKTEKLNIKYLECDIIEKDEGRFEIFKADSKPLIIHYGAGSNYEDVRTEEYIERKTQALIKML